MKLCVGTSKGIVILDPERGGVPLMVLADPSPVWCMAQDSAHANLIYAGSNALDHGHGAISRSPDGGRTWTEITPPSARDEEIWEITASPHVPGCLFVGTSHARLFRSDDAGRSFREMKAFLSLPGRDRWTFPPPPHIPHVRSVAFDPHARETIYVGVEEGGVFRSLDLGVSFEPLNDGLYEDVHAVAVDPEDPRRLYATTGAGFHLSEDAGASWRHVTDGFDRAYTVPVLVLDGQHPTIYTAAAAGPPPSWPVAPHGADSMIYRSTDRGLTFERAEKRVAPERGMPMRLRKSPDGSELFGVSTTGTVFRLQTGGEDSTPVAVAEKLPPAYDLIVLP